MQINKQDEKLLQELLKKYKQGIISGLYPGNNITFTPTVCRDKIISSTGGGGDFDLYEETTNYPLADPNTLTGDEVFFIAGAEGSTLTLSTLVAIIEENVLRSGFYEKEQVNVSRAFQPSDKNKILMLNTGVMLSIPVGEVFSNGDILAVTYAIDNQDPTTGFNTTLGGHLIVPFVTMDGIPNEIVYLSALNVDGQTTLLPISTFIKPDASDEQVKTGLRYLMDNNSGTQFIPLVGTEVGNPVTGDIEILAHGIKGKIYSNDGDYENNIDITKPDEGIYLRSKGSEFLINNDGISKGSYSEPITDNHYTQKQYVDTKLSRQVFNINTSTTADNISNIDYVYNISGGSTLTLPTAVGNTNEYKINNVDTIPCDIVADGVETIDGSSLFTLISQYDSITLISDGASWVAGGGGSSYIPPYLKTGGASWSGTGLVYDVTALEYYFNGDKNTSATQVTLDASDPVNNRLDAIVVDEAGVVSVIKGDASASPISPSVDESHILVQYILVEAGTTEPAIAKEDIYLENVEWTTSTYTTGTATGSIDFDNAVSPKQGVKCISANADARLGARFVRTTSFDPYQYTMLSMWVRFTGSNVATNKSLNVRFENGAGALVANTINLFNFGLQRNLLNVWQLVVIPITAFGALPATVKGMKIIMAGGTVGQARQWDIDYMILTNGSVPYANVPTIAFYKDDIGIASQSGINLIEGTGVTIDAVNNPLYNRVDYTINSSGGGIESIVAGDNITINDTDPLNPIVSASGGGSSAFSGLTSATANNTINNGAYSQEWQFNSLANGTGLKLSSNSTLASSNFQSIFEIANSGANATSTQTTYGAKIANTKTGTSATNVALQLSATGATNNYGLIVSNGNVGIGTTTPTDLLQISGNNNQMRLQGDNGSIKFYKTDNTYISGSLSAVAANYVFGLTAFNGLRLTFNTGNAERMTILDNGNVGIGTYAPNASAKLEISSTVSGFLPPRMTATQASAIASPAKSLIVYVTDTDGTFTSAGIWIYTTSWKLILAE